MINDSKPDLTTTGLGNSERACASSTEAGQQPKLPLLTRATAGAWCANSSRILATEINAARGRLPRGGDGPFPLPWPFSETSSDGIDAIDAAAALGLG